MCSAINVCVSLGIVSVVESIVLLCWFELYYFIAYKSFALWFFVAKLISLQAMADLTPHAFEKHVETQCNIILKKNSEFWEDRNKAIIELTVSHLTATSLRHLLDVNTLSPRT